MHKNKYHDIKNVFFELDDGEGGLDRYDANIDVWFIREAPTNGTPGIHYVDEIYINNINKNGMDLEFKRQDDIDEEIKQAILKELEYEV